MNTFGRQALGGVVASIFCGLCGLAAAGQPGGIVVTFSDLDLNTHSGSTTMYARLEAAARTMCTANEGPWSSHRISSCIDYSVRQAVAQIGAPQLVMLYETRSGHALLHARRQEFR